MSESETIIAQLNALHETRKQMQYASIYQGSYEAEAIRLNTRLKELTGRDYVDFPLWNGLRRRWT